MIVGLILFLPVSVKAELSYDEPVSVSMPSAAESLTNPSSSPVSVSMPPVAESLTNPLSSPVSVSMPPAAESLTNPSSSPVSVSIPSSFDSLTAPYAYPVSVGYEDAKNLLTDIVALYYLDGNWNDSSGNDYHLTGINGIEFTAEAKSGLMAGYLDGVNDLAFGNTTLAPDVTDNFTVSFWAKPTASRLVTNESNVDIQTTSNQEFVQTPGNGGGNIAGAGISIGKNGISIFENVGGNITSPLVYDFATELTDWTQVTVVYENKIPRVYINGVPVHSGQQSLSDAVSPTLYTMGGAWGGTGFTGYLDELAVFSRSFTDADVADIFGNGLGKDLYAPTILSTVPVISSIINNNVNEIKIALNDVSGVNLIASLDDAYLFDSLQNSIDGTWSVSEADVDTINFTPFSSLSTGTYTAVINPVDTHGNTAQRLFSFTIDQVSPTVSGFAMSPSSPHRAEKVSFTFTFSEAMDMSLQPSVIFVNGDATLGLTGVWSGNKKYSGYYTFVTGDVNGSYDVTVSGAKDVAGNVMTEVVVGSFELDTVLPLIPGVNTMDEIVATANVTVTGTKETGTALLINNLQKVSINSDETWSAIVSLNEGTNNLTFKAKDSAGNVSSGVTRTVVRDTQAPKFTVVYDGTVTESAVTFGGTKEAGIYMTVKVDGSTEVIANIDESVSTTKWSYDTTLIEGITKTFTIRAEDRAGNTREESIQITYDGSAPQPLALGVLQADGDRDGSDVLLNWSAYVEPNDLAYYIIYVSTEDFSDVTTLTPATTVTKGKTSYVVGGLTRGETYYFAVVPTDSVVEPESLVNTASAVPYDTVAPEDVTNLKATAGFNDADGDFIEYSWLGSVDTNLDLTHYNIYLNGVLVDTIGKTVTSYKKTDLNENSLYAFKITAVDDTNYESGGVQLSAVTRLPNPAITNLTTDSGTASLYWALPSTAYTNYIKHYNVYRVESADTILSVTLMGEPVASVGSRSFGESGLTNGTTYQYAVTAVNKFGAENYLVNSKSAEPKADSVGPVITIGGVSEGSVITRPVTITLGATDSTGVSSLKLFIDDTAINSLTLANPSYGWNIVNTTDGSHIVKAVATDSLGNESELIISVTVNLATPSTPSLGIARNSSITESTLNNLPVTVDSIATTLILKVNGDIERTMPLSSYTLISLNGIDLNEGTNVLSVETSNREIGRAHV